MAGVECSFVQEAIRSAVALARKHPRWKVQVTWEQERLAMDRASCHQDLLKGTRILWVDDVPENNQNEIKLFHQLQADIDTATSTGEATEMYRSANIGEGTKEGTYDIVISDIKRGDDITAGLDMLDIFHHHNTLIVRQFSMSVNWVLKKVRRCTHSGSPIAPTNSST